MAHGPARPASHWHSGHCQPHMAADSAVLWEPSAERVAASQLTGFREAIAAKHGLVLPDYAALHAWSLRDREAFWREVWELGDVVGEGPLTPTLLNDVMPGASWFPETRLNYAENCLRRRDAAAPAIISSVEGAHRRSLSWEQLYRQVAKLSAWLREQGVGPGVRCAAYTPNVPEAVIAMLAVTSLGGVWSSCSPDFGASAVLDRLGQVQPKVLFVCDAYTYKGRSFDRLAEVADVLRGLDSVEHCVILSEGASPAAAESLGGTTASSVVLLDAVLQQVAEPPAEISFERVPFDAPLYIMFSSVRKQPLLFFFLSFELFLCLSRACLRGSQRLSDGSSQRNVVFCFFSLQGTTGVPKAMIHSVGGTLLQHIKEHRLHTDLHADDRLFYFTTCGWMMWNWLVTALASGCTLVLFDGNPTGEDDPALLFQLCEDEAITHFGTSAKFIDSINKMGFVPKALSDYPALLTILSTGSVLSPESFDWVYESFKADVALASITGGTDILSCFALGQPDAPVRRGELQCAGLGMATAVYGDDGAPVRSHGEQGELVCTKAFPSVRKRQTPSFSAPLCQFLILMTQTRRLAKTGSGQRSRNLTDDRIGVFSSS